MNDNYAVTGFTFQKMICDKYRINPSSEKAINMFNSNFDSELKSELSPIVDKIFDILDSNPIECTTFERYNGKDLPFNFILENNSTLSIRTNIKGDKVAPREVGQAGYEKLNQYFSFIYGKKIESKEDIKKLICFKINEVLPIFLRHLFDADYIAWIYKKDNKFNCELINGDSFVDIDFDKNKFSFTRDYSTWTESTTLKYDGKSIAEIQIHKNRTFKFRAIMKNILLFTKSKIITTETFGITAEKTICDIFNLKYPKNFISRYSPSLETKIKPTLEAAFTHLPAAIKHCGSDKGTRGGLSKCAYDFILLGNKTLSLKTNTGKMVCPPEVGQPNSTTCYLYFKNFVKETYIDKDNFKTMVYEHIHELIPIYLEHMFDSDFLLRLFENNNNYKYQIIQKNYGMSILWDKTKFDFSKKNIAEWSESNTLYYDGISLGEFQIHNNRNCFKFRFNFNNLIKIIEDARQYYKKNNLCD